MQVIAELERDGRGAYTGALGWLHRDGDLDLNILIRSAEVEGAELRFRARAGTVAASEPRHELDETRTKACGRHRALAMQETTWERGFAGTACQMGRTSDRE